MVDSRGRHISYDLSHTAGGDNSHGSGYHQYYRIDAFGQTLVLNLTKHAHFLSKGATVEYWSGVDAGRPSSVSLLKHGNCYFTGTVVNSSQSEGWAALSICGGAMVSMRANKKINSTIVSSWLKHMVEGTSMQHAVKCDHTLLVL